MERFWIIASVCFYINKVSVQLGGDSAIIALHILTKSDNCYMLNVVLLYIKILFTGDIMESLIDVVLKFSDNRNVWKCPECDTENNMMSESCDICGCVRYPNVEVVSLYEPPIPVNPYANAGGTPYGGAPYGGAPYGGAPYGGAPYGGSSYGGGPMPGEKNSSGVWVAIGVIAFVIFLIIIAAVAQS